MAVLDGAAQSAARSADARRVGAVMRKVRETASRPGQAGQSPTVSPGLPSLPSTPTRVQPPAEAAPAAATPTTTGRGSTTRPRDEIDEQPRRETRPRSPPPEPMQEPPWFKEVAAKLEEAAQAEAASEAAPVGGGDLSAAMKMFGAMVVMDREADAQRCARLVGWMPPVQCNDTGRVYHPRKFLPTPGLTALTTAVPAALATSSGAAAPAAPMVPAWGLEHLDANCPICQEVLGTDGDVVQLQCPQPPGASESAPHLFHLKCITHHAKTCGTRGFGGTPGSQPSCPTCRAPMTHCRSVQTGKLQPLTAEAEAGQSAAPVTSLADRAALRQLAQLQQDLPQAPPGSVRAAMRFGPDYYEGPPSRSSGTRHGPRPTAASTSSAPPRATRGPATSASPTDAVDAAAASPAAAASASASTNMPAAAARGSHGSAEPPSTPMETDEPHASPPPAAADEEGGGDSVEEGGGNSAGPTASVTGGDS